LPTVNLQPSIFNQPNLPTAGICSSKNGIVPQTTNVQNLATTHNNPYNQPLKSQESYLFLEEDFLNFFYSKITAQGKSIPQTPTN
jgi:hypothetical protein